MNQVQDVRIQTVLRPYKADNILNFSIRYIVTGTIQPISRAKLLSTLLLNTNNSTTNYRLCAAVRVNRVKLTCSAIGSLEWLSAYGPTSATVITGTSATAAAELIQRPPKNSLASMWSLTASNESELMFVITASMSDYVDVDFSVVLMDQETAVSVTTGAGGNLGRVYRSYLDGPATGASLQPVYMLYIN